MTKEDSNSQKQLHQKRGSHESEEAPQALNRTADWDTTVMAAHGQVRGERGKVDIMNMLTKAKDVYEQVPTRTCHQKNVLSLPPSPIPNIPSVIYFFVFTFYSFLVRNSL